MPLKSKLALFAGLLLTVVLAAIAGEASDTPIAEDLTARSQQALAAAGASEVKANFYTSAGSPTRHPLLSGGEGLDEDVRDRAAKAVGGVHGVGSVQWVDGTARQQASETEHTTLRCQDDVEVLLRTRTIRFEESSAAIEAASLSLVDEVAEALRPCLGSIIAITGHTDNSGTAARNIALSRQRAFAVRDALIERGIPADGLRARGVGDSEPVEGLSPSDPANRRIEFSVLATVPITPTPVDVPGPR